MKKNDLKEQLKTIQAGGFQTDQLHLMEDLCRQFPDRKFFVKEYVVNAADAGATRVIISGIEKDGYITVTIQDNGKGMNKKKAVAFFKVFYSAKATNNKTAGQFGIGKLAVAAIPNQSKFEMLTSTGKECWHVTTGAFKKNETIKFVRLNLNRPKGTEFKITYKLTTSLTREMETLKRILENSVCFLKPEIIVFMPMLEDEKEFFPAVINQKWPGNGIHYEETFRKKIEGNWYTITLGLGKTFQGIYQNQVFVTDKFNLLQPSKDGNKISNLSVMIESRAFVLPFGRHTIQNEDCLIPIAATIRVLLIEFYKTLFSLFKRSNLPVSDYEFDVFTSDLIYCFPDGTINSPWLLTPVFKGAQEDVYSYNDLYNAVRDGGNIYFADSTLAGVDFSKFKNSGIVLSNEQNGKCSQILKEKFIDVLFDLSNEDLIMEEPGTGLNDAKLSSTEKMFQNHLGFQSNLIRSIKSGKGSSNNLPFSLAESNRNQTKKAEKELRSANMQLENLRWRVSRLIERNATPCITHLYLFEKPKQSVILNLNHPKTFMNAG